MIKIYNTLTKTKQKLVPIKGNKINFFVCGPTVYNYSHLGHARTYVFFDAFVKYLRYKKYNVFYLQNITDIDDKIIKKAQQQQIKPNTLARKFEKIYFQDMQSLNVNAVSKYARATDNIKEIINQTQLLVEKNFAYINDDGVYYDISKFKDYGKLSRRTTTQAEDGVSRIDESVKKRNKGDFCLWKLSKPNEPKWKSPWGWGRPGWHIEDTAISEKYFGYQYDIHGGAKDLIFPHHEAEIAQIQAISNKKPFVKYWMHTGFLTIKGDKMSKSLNNFVTIKDFLKNNSPRTLRLLILKSNYRSSIDYNEKNTIQAIQELKKIDEFINNLELLFNKKIKTKSQNKIIEKNKKELDVSLKNDFDTPRFFAVLFNFITEINKLINNQELSSKDAQSIFKMLQEIDSFLAFIIVPKDERLINLVNEYPKKIQKLIEIRQKYRENKQWQKADETRKDIEKLGYLIEDTKQGIKVKKQ